MRLFVGFVMQGHINIHITWPLIQTTFISWGPGGRGGGGGGHSPHDWLCTHVHKKMWKGGGGVTHHMTGYAPMSKKKWGKGGGGGSLATGLAMHPCPKKNCGKGVFFRPFSLQRGVFLMCHHTYGVPSNKMLEAYIHNSILGYHSQYHNNKNMPFGDIHCRFDVI